MVKIKLPIENLVTQNTARALLLTNIGQLLTLRPPGGTEVPRRGSGLAEISILHSAAVFCRDGKILLAGAENEVIAQVKKEAGSDVDNFDCQRGVVLPGFVDSHTHPAFIAPRLLDFEQRIQGSTYEQIAKAGGGIRSSVDDVRKATEEELACHIFHAFESMQKTGTTTIEAKSGYGLSTESELKSLRAIRRAAERWPGSVVPTLLAAHVVPSEFRDKPESYLDLICKEIIPVVAREHLAEFVDVFCERGAFNVTQTRRIFQAARQAGLGSRAHVCQFTPQDLSNLTEFDPASYDHLDCLTDRDLEALAKQNTIATLLPGASYFLAHGYPMPRRLIEAGCAIALATDFNPGTSPTTSMLSVLSLACTQMRMTPAQAITAATINGAHALRLAAGKGSVEPGKDADLGLFDVKDYRELCYWFGRDICRATVLNGRLISHMDG